MRARPRPDSTARSRPPRAAAGLLVLSLLGASPAPGTTAPAADPVRELDISVVRGGALTRYRMEGSRLVLRVPPDEVAVDRALTPDERARLLRAVRAVLDDPDTQFTCQGGETWVSVALDGKTNSNALCPGRPHHPTFGARWLVLLVVMEDIGGRRDLPVLGPVR